MKKKLSKQELALKKIAAALQAYVNDHIANIENPHGVTKTQIGLGNVTNDAQVKRSEMGANNGVATLGSNGKVISSQLPSYTLDDVLDGSNRKIPTKVSELTNDSGFLTGHQSLVDYATKTFVENKFKDAFGINASGVSDLAAILADEDYTTGILNVIANKVDKVSGKGLSTNDYTTTEKNKLSGIEAGAQAHIAPTSTEVKSALGTGSGTSKYLREDGTWQVPPNNNTTYGLSVGTGDDANKIVLTPSSGTADKITVPYASNAGTVNGKTVAKNVPSDAVFTDTTYESKAAANGGTDVSLVTTEEKYTWNNKLDYNSNLFTTNNFAEYQDRSLYISKIDNGLYLADKRFTTSMSINGATSFVPISLFDGNYETRYNIPDGLSAVITIDFSVLPSSKFPEYPYGKIFVCFYGGRTPKTITGRVYNNYASLGVGWKTITFVLYRTGGTIYFADNNYYGLLTIEITIEARDSSTYSETGPCLIEFRMNRPGSNLTPMVSKYFAETLYFPLTAPSFIGNLTGKVNNYTINSNVPSNAVFTDTTYSVMGASGSTHASGLVPDTPSVAGTTKYLREDGTWQTPSDTNTWRPLGTGADDACAGNDSRLSNSRPASDVYAWAKAATKPSYSYSEISGTPTAISSSFINSLFSE